MSKKALIHSDGVPKFLYLIVINDGIPLKITYAKIFYPSKTEYQNLKLLFSIFMKNGTFLKVTYTKKFHSFNVSKVSFLFFYG